jgi:DUF4097 and DUF4098 domain-containing protein YvlB
VEALSKTLATAISVGVALGMAACDEDGVGPNESTVYVEEPFSVKVAVANQTRVTLQGINGNIEIFGRAQVDSFTVAGERRVGSFSTEDAQEHFHLLEVVVTDAGDELQVETRQPASSSGRSYTVNYELTVPQNLDLEIGNLNGNIVVKTVRSTITLGTLNGNIALEDIEGNVTAEATNGSVVAEVILPIGGTAHLVTTNGNVTLSVPATTSAELTATLANGDIQIQGLSLQDPVSTNTSLSGTLGAGEGSITLRTVNGNIFIMGSSPPPR